MQIALRIDARLARPGVGHAVEIGDLAQAVAAELERVRERAHAVLAGVEHVLEVDGRVGVAVGDHELGDRRPVADRAPLAGVHVADVVQRQPLARVKPDPQVPALPLQPAAVEHVARALGLGDLDREQAGAVRSPAAVAVVAALARRRRRPGGVVVNPQHRHVVQVDHGHEPVQRPGIGVVAVIVAAQPRDRPRLPRRARLERPARPCLDVHRSGIDPSLPHRLDVAGVGPHGGGDRDELLDVDRGLHPLGQVDGRQQPVFVERHEHLDAAPALVVEHDAECLSRQRPARLLPGQVGGLGGLAHLDRHDPQPVGQTRRSTHDRNGAGHLVGRQGIERVRATHRRERRSSGRGSARARG